MTERAGLLLTGLPVPLEIILLPFLECFIGIFADDTSSARAARRSWARLIKKIYEVDPLLCPECGGDMRIIAFIEEYVPFFDS